MATTTQHRSGRKMQRQLNNLFVGVNSFIGSMYRSLLKSPRFFHDLANSKHKTRHNQRKR